MRSKLLFLLSFCFSVSFVWAQDYQRIDATIELYPNRVNTPEELSKFITRDFLSEEEKVRAIYTWIIKNVAYDPEEYKKFNYNFKNYRERNQKEEKTRKKIIARTLQKGIAVCEGYAMLFEKLCELQGISNYLVRGDIKTHFDDIGRPFKNVHMWNVATINGEPYLFDPTWGAGKYRGKFIAEPSYVFYKADPIFLVKTHYPQQLEDAFLNTNLSKEDFSMRPIIIDTSLNIDDLEIQKVGIISSESETGSIPFRIKRKKVTKVAYSFGDEKVTIPFSEETNTLTFTIPIALGKQELLIYFDDQPALGYKLK